MTDYNAFQHDGLGGLIDSGFNSRNGGVQPVPIFAYLLLIISTGGAQRLVKIDTSTGEVVWVVEMPAVLGFRPRISINSEGVYVFGKVAGIGTVYRFDRDGALLRSIQVNANGMCTNHLGKVFAIQGDSAGSSANDVFSRYSPELDLELSVDFATDGNVFSGDQFRYVHGRHASCDAEGDPWVGGVNFASGLVNATARRIDKDTLVLSTKVSNTLHAGTRSNVSARGGAPAFRAADGSLGIIGSVTGGFTGQNEAQLVGTILPLETVQLSGRPFTEQQPSFHCSTQPAHTFGAASSGLRIQSDPSPSGNRWAKTFSQMFPDVTPPPGTARFLGALGLGEDAILVIGGSPFFLGKVGEDGENPSWVHFNGSTALGGLDVSRVDSAAVGISGEGWSASGLWDNP